MITLINLRKKGNIIEADYYHEDKKDELGHFKYDVNNGKYIDVNYAGGSKQYGFVHIENDLKLLIRHNVFPEKRVILWY